MWKPRSFEHRVAGTRNNPRRYAWTLQYGPTDDSLYLMCGQGRCVWPDHAGKAKDRFWSRVDKAEDGCWYWRGSTVSGGYPHLRYDGVSVYAHRLTFEWAGNVLEDGSVLKHTCEHLDCVNPDHLYQVTLAEMVDIREKERLPTICTECGGVFRNLEGHRNVHT